MREGDARDEAAPSAGCRGSGAGRWVLLPFVVTLWLAGPPGLPGQDPGFGEATHWNRHMLAPGLKHGTLTFTTWEGARDAVFVEGEFRYPAVAASLRIAGEGPWQALPLAQAAGEDRPAAAIAVDIAPDLEQAVTFSGLRLSESAMWSWDREPGYHLLLHADGSARIVHRGEGTAEIRFEDAGSWPVRSLNGPLPEEPGELSIYTGPVGAGERPVADWPRDMELHLLANEDGRPGSAVRMLHPGRDETPLLIPSSAPQRANLRLGEAELLAVVKPPVPEELEGLLARGAPARLHFETSREERLARAVFPVSEVLMRGGQLRDTDLERPLDGVLLGVDPAGRRIAALGQSRARHTAQTLTLGRAVQYLVAEGYTEAALLSTDGPALVPDLARPHEHSGSAGRAVRSLLLLHGGARSVELAGAEGRAVRIEGIVVQGTRREFPVNQPGRLRDGRVTAEPDLAGFWASPSKPVSPDSTQLPQPEQARIRFLLPRPARLQALELVHAEAMGFGPQFNLRSYVIRGRASRENPWEELVRVRHDEPVPRERVALPGTPRLSEVELLVLEPNFLPGGNVARLAEIHFWSPEEQGR